MMSEKNSKTKVPRYIGIVAVLLLIAVAFVGSAGADDVKTEEQLWQKVQLLSNPGDVTITLGNSIELNNEQHIKDMVKSLSDAFLVNKNVKKLIVNFNTHSIYVNRNSGNEKIEIGGSDAVTVERVSDSGQYKTHLTTTGKVFISAKYGADTVKYEDVQNVNMWFNQSTNSLTLPSKITVTTGTGKISVDSLTYQVKEVKIADQPIYVDASDSPKIKVFSKGNGYQPTSMNGYILLDGDTKIEGTNVVIEANGNTQALTAFGRILDATVTYTPNGDTTKNAVVKLENVEGAYNKGIKDVIGTAKLQTNLEITHVLPVPNFVTEANLWLNGKTLSTTDSNNYFDYKGSIKVKVMSPGFIKKVGSGEYTTQFDKASSYSGKTLLKRNTGDKWEFYVENGGSGGGGGGGGSVVIPTYTPDVTPTPTTYPTGVPTIYPTGIPTQQPQSPMPIFGILAGLGAVALAGVVLRRK